MESVKGKDSTYLLDTHVLLWWLFDYPKLSGSAHDVIQAPCENKGVDPYVFLGIPPSELPEFVH